MNTWKNETEEALALAHLPVILFDEKEPFPVELVGYTVFRESGKSPSSPRMITVGEKNRALCIEYAVYFDYDIQHLYDLEHIWVYLDEEGKTVDCECSFHGMYLRAWGVSREILGDDGRVRLYSQPGKHAMMPSPELFHLFLEFQESCGKTAGKDGILDPGFLKGFPEFTEEESRKTERYIKERYSFIPSEKYQPVNLAEKLLPWAETAAEIPGRIGVELEKIRNA